MFHYAVVTHPVEFNPTETYTNCKNVFPGGTLVLGSKSILKWKKNWNFWIAFINDIIDPSPTNESILTIGLEWKLYFPVFIKFLNMGSLLDHHDSWK